MDQTAYIAALQSHDWTYEYSDDHRVWTKGNAERATLVSMRRQLDPDWTLWNQHAPEQFRSK